jgi:hypothetical protein
LSVESDHVFIDLPTMHSGQADLYRSRTQYNVISCGRRWGKTKALVTLAADYATKGRKVGVFTPEHKQLTEPYDEIRGILRPIEARASKNEGLIHTNNGGVVDFWPLNDNELAGRGREYHRVLIDEAAYTKPVQMWGIWEKSIKPTMLTTRGDAWVFSTPSGINPDNYFHRLVHEPKLGFRFYHAPTASNPYVPLDELERIRLDSHPLVWKQEYLAEFVDWSSDTFFKLDYFLDQGKPVAYPAKCDGVFAIMDCAVKSGSVNDGTGVLYCSISNYHGHRLIWLDYELHAIEAASLEFLAPSILKRCEDLAKQCGARQGSLGLLVEDAAGGSVLIQQAAPRGWPITAIDSKFTAKGKDERAMLAGGPAYRGDVKVSQYAFDKVVEWKGRTLNHLLQQVNTFHIGDKDAAKRADDLLDCATYSIIVACVDHRTF